MGRVRVGNEYLPAAPSCRLHCCDSVPAWVVAHLRLGWRISWADVPGEVLQHVGADSGNSGSSKV